MIFVTGGTGFLGRHLIATLCRAGHPLKVLTRYPEKNRWLQDYPSVEVIPGDLREKAKLIQAMDGCQHVVHAGGVFRFWGNAQHFIENNTVGTQNMLDAAAQVGVERFIDISTVAVVGQPDPTNIIDETYPPQPVEPYQRSKYAAEKLALRYYHERNVPVVILRPGAYYGPLGEYGFNRLFFRDPMRGIIMQLSGGKHIIFPAYIIDVAQGILQALEKARVGEIYNITGDWISHKEVFDIVCEEADLRFPRTRIPGWMGITASRLLELLAVVTRREPFWPINMRSYVYNDWRVSNEKARCDLGFAPTSFRDGARRTIAWYRAGKPQDIPEIAL
jgi:nucleoside-diphosphate-sugar epimerase